MNNRATTRIKAALQKNLYWLLWLLPLALATVCWATYPFSEEIGKKTLCLSGLSAIQKSNIQLASRAVNGVVLRPGDEFSFNGIVGPRTTARGYRPAPSYLGPENPATVGGGICLFSSALYQVALESGLKVKERFAHLRTIKTIPPGLDATVWYGQSDLKFKNTLDVPVQLAAAWSSQSLTVTVLGRQARAHSEPVELKRLITRANSQEMVVELFTRKGRAQTLVSRDLYAISR